MLRITNSSDSQGVSRDRKNLHLENSVLYRRASASLSLT